MNIKSFIAPSVAIATIYAGIAQADNWTHYSASDRLVNAVNVHKVRLHQKWFSFLASGDPETRASGTPGYDNSVKYVAWRMKRAGYDVQIQDFDFISYRPLGPSTLSNLSTPPLDYVEDVDYTLMSQTEPGDVSGDVSAVDLDLGPGNASSSGCEPEDFAGFPAPPAKTIALLQRGACAFQVKAENAAAAGAVGAIIFNQGNTEDRKGLINATLSAEYMGGIPVFFATYDRGVEWAGTAGLQLSMIADVLREEVITSNVIAESRDGDPNNVIVVGGHLDSVIEGPGIQDNGSGSAAILEVGLQLAKRFKVNSRTVVCHKSKYYPDRSIRVPNRPKFFLAWHLKHGDTLGPCEGDVAFRNKVRFTWWGAEESGLVGSDFYVQNLTDEEREKIALYLNFDMIGSSNYARFVYDGDGSAFGLEGPAGSAAIETLYEQFYEERGLASEPTEISFRSDYAAFFDFDIPFGGLFTGAEGIKTPDQVNLYGGTAGEQYDPCYHLACDTFDNINLDILELNSKAVAHSVITYAVSDTDVVLGLTTEPAIQSLRQRSNRAAAAEYRGHEYIR